MTGSSWQDVGEVWKPVHSQRERERMSPGGSEGASKAL